MGRLDPEILDQILETLNDYAEKQLPSEKLLEIEHKDEFPEKVMKDLYDPGQIGLHLLTIPEDLGGLGGGAYDIYRVSEDMAAIDLGSNSFHLILAKIEHGEMRPVEALAEKVQLGAGLENARPGKTCEDIAIAFFDQLEKHGFHKENRTGYSIGLSYPPDWGERTMSLRPGDTTELQENMTLHFMTGLWMDSWGFEITESIVITPSGAECLAEVPRKLLVKD